jgi:hypothetical protein
MDTTTLIGAGGAALLLAAFALNEFHILDGESRIYQVINLLGAALLTWYAILLHSAPFIVLEGIWTVVALWQFVRLAQKAKNR